MSYFLNLHFFQASKSAKHAVTFSKTEAKCGIINGLAGIQANQYIVPVNTLGRLQLSWAKLHIHFPK